MRNWQRRWFVLKDNFLYFYDYSLLDQGSIARVGSIPHSGLAVLSNVVVRMRRHRTRKMCFEVPCFVLLFFCNDLFADQITHDERRTIVLDAECSEDLSKVRAA
jgi:hypothetical protein